MRLVGRGQVNTACTLEASTATPWPETVWPKYLTWVSPNEHLDNLANNLCFFNNCKTASKCCKWEDQVGLYTDMS